jgi:hypothetical protein
VAGTVGRGAGALHGRPFAELRHVPAEGALVDLSLLGAREGDAIVLELIDGRRRVARQVFHGVVVAQPVRALDGIVHVPLPVVGAHVLEARGNAALRGDGVRAGREDFCDAGGPQALLGHAQRGSQAGAAGAHDHHVEFVVDEFVCGHPPNPRLPA